MSRFISALDPLSWSATSAAHRDSSSSSRSSTSKSFSSSLGSAKSGGAVNVSSEEHLVADAGLASCGHCNSEKCCNSVWPFKDLALETRPAGVLGPFTWCGLTVFVAVAGSQHESSATTEYRRDILSERLTELTLPLDIAVSDEPVPKPTPRSKSPVKDVIRSSKEYTLEEVNAHKQKDDVWIAVADRVLDVTKWKDQHPGGVDVIMGVAGKDATAEFNSLHEPGVIDQYAPGAVIGTLIGSAARYRDTFEVLDRHGGSYPASDGSGSGELDEREPEHTCVDGVIQCDCRGTDLIPFTKPTPPVPHSHSEPPVDVSKPANAAVAAEVTALLSQLQSLISSQGSGLSLKDLMPKLAINYTCEDVDEDEEEGVQMELVVKFKAKKGADGQHPMCVQARAALGAEGRCGGR